MQIFASCLAWGPPAVYLLVLGWINCRRRPLVVNGTREISSLALALAGCVLIGPGQLLLPADAASRFAAGVWVLLSLLYVLGVTLVVLFSRPRLVIYSTTASDVRLALEKVAVQLGAPTRWAGDTLTLELLGLDLRVEEFAPLGNVSLIANSDHQSSQSWCRLEQLLRSNLAEVPSRRSPRGGLLLATGALVLLAIVYRVVENPAAMGQGLLEFLGP
jgi:hypothetical protein